MAASRRSAAGAEPHVLMCAWVDLSAAASAKYVSLRKLSPSTAQAMLACGCNITVPKVMASEARRDQKASHPLHEPKIKSMATAVTPRVAPRHQSRAGVRHSDVSCGKGVLWYSLAM